MITQHAPLVFSGSGWLALMSSDGKPVAVTEGTRFPLPGRMYWKPIDEKTAAMYRLTLGVIE